MEIDYKHDWYVDEEAWFIRFYLWLYQASLTDVNFCKLFWAYVFCVPVLFARGIAFPFIWLWNGIGSMESKPKTNIELSNEQIAKAKKKAAKKKAKEARGPSWPVRFLNAVGKGFSLFLLKLEDFIGWLGSNKQVNYVLGRIVLGAGILAGAALVSFVVYQAIVNFDITIWVLAVLAAIGVALLFVLALKAIGFFDAAQEEVLRPVGGAVRKGGMGFGRVMAIGYAAVKSNTCPKIVVRGHEDESSARVSAT